MGGGEISFMLGAQDQRERQLAWRVDFSPPILSTSLTRVCRHGVCPRCPLGRGKELGMEQLVSLGPQEDGACLGHGATRNKTSP